MWARGQAWAIPGFSQTYMWTGQREFLDGAARVPGRGVRVRQILFAAAFQTRSARNPWTMSL